MEKTNIYKKAPYLTFQERQMIEKLLSQREAINDIARIMGRDRSNIRKEIMRGGGKENYKAEEGQKIRTEKMSGQAGNFHANCYQSLSQKITVLEMQVQVLSDLVKEIMGKIT